MKHRFALLAQETLDWLHSTPAETLKDSSRGISHGIVIIVITVIAVICFASIITWIITGDNPIEQIDDIFDADIEGYFAKQSNKRDLKKFKQGDICVLLKRCNNRDSLCCPNFMSNEYDVPPTATQQDIFDFNLGVLKSWMMFHKTDVTWENMVPYICHSHEIFKLLFIIHNSNKAVSIPNELLEVLLKHKEAFYAGLDCTVYMKNYSRDWTQLYYAAQNGNKTAQELLDWVDYKRTQGGNQNVK